MLPAHMLTCNIGRSLKLPQVVRASSLIDVFHDSPQQPPSCVPTDVGSRFSVNQLSSESMSPAQSLDHSSRLRLTPLWLHDPQRYNPLMRSGRWAQDPSPRETVDIAQNTERGSPERDWTAGALSCHEAEPILPILHSTHPPEHKKLGVTIHERGLGTQGQASLA